MNNIAHHVYYLYKGLFGLASICFRIVFELLYISFVFGLAAAVFYGFFYGFLYWLSVFFKEDLSELICFKNNVCINDQVYGVWGGVFFWVVILIAFLKFAYNFGKKLDKKGSSS